MGGRVKPGTLAPFFTLVALIHAAAVVSRCDVVAAELPADAHTIVLVAQLPLIVLAGYLEGRLEYGAHLEDFPLWMRIDSTPVKLALTFAFIYLTLVPLQTWDVSLGPIDPTPPLGWPAAQRVGWFVMFTFVMFFPFYLGATGFLIPVLRVLTAPLRRLPTVLAVPLALGLGAAAGVGAVSLIGSKQVGGAIGRIKDAIAASPGLTVAVIVATTALPTLLGVYLDTRDTSRSS